MRLSCLTAVVVLVVGWSLQVTAAEPRRLVHTRQAGTETCPDARSTEAGVAARLGYRPFSPAAGSALAVRYQRHKGAIVARIEITDGQGKVVGRRELTAKAGDCAELGRRVELAIAIAIDPLASSRKTTTEPEEVPSFPPPATGDAAPAPPPEEPPPEPKPGSDAGAPIWLSGSLGGLLAVGSAPAVTGGFELGLRLGWRSLSVGLAGRFDLPAREAVQATRWEAALLTGGERRLRSRLARARRALRRPPRLTKK